jgi:hypothetical protein
MAKLVMIDKADLETKVVPGQDKRGKATPVYNYIWKVVEADFFVIKPKPTLPGTKRAARIEMQATPLVGVTWTWTTERPFKRAKFFKHELQNQLQKVCMPFTRGHCEKGDDCPDGHIDLSRGVIARE